MKLIMENWRKFNEEEERNPAQKLSQSFLRNAQQAIHLSEELDELEIAGVMKDTLKWFHGLMRLYLYWTEAYQAGEYETKSMGHLYPDDIIVKGRSSAQRVGGANQYQEWFRESLQELDDLTGNMPVDLYQELWGITEEIIGVIDEPSISGDPKEHPVWLKAAQWAGEPPRK